MLIHRRQLYLQRLVNSGRVACMYVLYIHGMICPRYTYIYYVIFNIK